MASEKKADVFSVPETAPAVVEAEHAGSADVKEAKVMSVALADALAKDKPNYKSRVQITMYLFMVLDTLS
ncbi:hypothetical protein IMZ48_22520 [Candidatus Bathyarchaeota archaeon]|nr:hypothetical protein [Candidatus Bathyarchaeota archaeon]